MSAFPDWEKSVVRQRRQLTGCIPTGYEILLRAASVTGIDYDTFQDDFDLDRSVAPADQFRNSFQTVAEAIERRYPSVHFEWRIFPQGEGRTKLNFIEDLIALQRPVLISLSLAPYGVEAFHIMPVVDATENELFLLDHMDADDGKHLWRLLKSELVRIHDGYEGGNDVAYLDTMRSEQQHE